MITKCVLAIAVLALLAIPSGLASELSDEEWAELRSAALNRRRQIIHNTDGCDALYFPFGPLPEEKLAVTPENFIAQRLIYVKGTKIDAIFYCPVASGFGHLTTRTKVGDRLLAHAPQIGWVKGRRNVTAELHAMGTDPLQLAIDFSRKHGFEIFVSLRVNDSHDISHREDRPHFLFNQFKIDNPELLMGTYENRPPHAAWTAVDFTHKKVREHHLALVRELFTDYALDGIELDFCRHLRFFRSVAWGGEASPEELEMMTDIMRETRAMSEEIGRKRGRPILIAIRVPDSVSYNKAVGLDIERWMQEGLIDILITGFYLQLNPWEYSVELARRHGVQFFPSMDESRIGRRRRISPGFERHNTITDRARIAAALQAGAHGIYYFNRDYGNIRYSLSSLRGNMDDIRLESKRYFITYRCFPLTRYLRTGDDHLNLRKLSPYTPVLLFPGEPQRFILEVGDDFEHPLVKQANPTFTAYADIDDDDGSRLLIKVNGQMLERIKTNANITTFRAPLELFRPGVNDIALAVLPAKIATRRERLILSGAKILEGRAQPPWRRLFTVHDFPGSEKIIDGAYRIADTGTKNEKANLLYPLSGVGEDLIVRFQAKVESSSEPLAAAFRMANRRHLEIVTLQPDRIGLYFIGKSVPFNTTDRFHDYEVIMRDGHFILKVNGNELFNEPLKMEVNDPEGHLKNYRYAITHMHCQSLLFGSLSGPGTGAALWKNVRLDEGEDSVQVRDLKFELYFSKTGPLAKYHDISPEWKFNFNVADGIIPAAREIRNTYRRGNLTVVAGEKEGSKALLFKHLEGYQEITVNDEALTSKGSGILLAEWKMKYLSGVSDQGGFLVVFRPLNAKKQVLLCPLAFFADKVVAPWGTMTFDKSIKDRWVTFRMALDVSKDTAKLWMNGKKLGAGSVPTRAEIEPNIFFGDGSGRIAGKVKLEYMKVTTVD